MDARHQLPALDGPPPGEPRLEEPAVLGRHRHRPAAHATGRGDGRGALRGRPGADRRRGHRAGSAAVAQRRRDDRAARHALRCAARCRRRGLRGDRRCCACLGPVGERRARDRVPPESIPAMTDVVALTCNEHAIELGLIKPPTEPPVDATDTERLMAAAGRTITRR